MRSDCTAPYYAKASEHRLCSHRITQKPYTTVFYSVVRAKTDARQSPSSLRAGLVSPIVSVSLYIPHTTMYGVQWYTHTACACMPALCNISNCIAYIYKHFPLCLMAAMTSTSLCTGPHLSARPLLISHVPHLSAHPILISHVPHLSSCPLLISRVPHLSARLLLFSHVPHLSARPLLISHVLHLILVGH